MAPFLTHHVASVDGTPIAVHSIGHGPELLIVHGAMQSGMSQSELAELLSDRFRVHLIDRRGRGGSGGAAVHAPAEEVADLRAVLDATGAERVFGVSSGAIVAARTALDDPRIRWLGLFEPPLPIAGSVRLELASRLDRAVERGDLPTVMGLGMKIAQMGPPWMFGLPVPVLAALSRGQLRSESVRDAASGLPSDLAIVRENADRQRDFARISARTLLLDGTATRPYLRAAIAALADVIPGSRHVALPGEWHSVTGNARDRGRPGVVAPVLEGFFGAAAQ